MALFLVLMFFLLMWACPSRGIPLYNWCTCKARKYRKKLARMPPGVYYRGVGLDLGDYSVKVGLILWSLLYACACVHLPELDTRWASLCVEQAGWFQVDDGKQGTFWGQTVGTSIVAAWSVELAAGKRKRMFAMGTEALDRIRQVAATPTKVYYCLKRLLLNRYCVGHALSGWRTTPDACDCYCFPHAVTRTQMSCHGSEWPS